jgi:hypothetical protein
MSWSDINPLHLYRDTKGTLQGQIQYNRDIFLEHIQDYYSLLEGGKTNPKIAFFLSKLDAFMTNMEDHPNSTNENIYLFLRDKELRDFLSKEHINASLLPREDEWNKDPFRSSVFNYVNKMEILRKKDTVRR